MNAMRLTFLALILNAPILPAVAPAEIWSAADIGKTSGALAAEANKSDLAGKTLGAFGNHSTAVWRRARSGRAELHRAKTDLIIVTEGQATLISGGTIPDGKATSPVEVRGSSITGGESRTIGPGDIIRIPAGTPHQFILPKDHTLTYFAVKIAR
jgi:hypothetical protein